MKMIDIEDARTHLSRLVDEAAEGEVFIITVNGEPMAKIEALDGSETLT
ncbi:type II toxin-antitoxin system Phd/YefM family antitoxin [Brevundimonas sp. DWR2-3-1b1]